MDRCLTLKKLLSGGVTLVVPDAYDGISARLIQACGFQAVQCSGYSYSLSKGYKKETALTIEENIRTTTEIVRAVDLPVMADGEDGYGTGEEFHGNLVRFIQAGIAGINIEDQNLWNEGDARKVVPVEVMFEKISTVRKIRTELSLPDFILNARTDALAAGPDRNSGLKNAIERANAYLEKGADLCFVTQVKTKEEMRLLAKEIHGPLSIAAGLPYNIGEFGIADCREAGVTRVSLPSLLVYSAIQAMRSVLVDLKENASFEGIIAARRLIEAETLAGLLN